MNESRINVYICEKCGGHTTTVDVDEGVTPFMMYVCTCGKWQDSAQS